MTDTLYVATNAGLAVCQREQEAWRLVTRALTEYAVTTVIAREGVILAGTTRGILRSDDNGQHWSEVNQGLNSAHVRWLAYHPDISNREFAGTEPARIFISHNGAEKWDACVEVETMRDEYGWMLPYSPEAGCVRGFAFHGRRIYAAVEVGGVLRSDDSGESWALAEGSNGNPDLGEPPEAFVYPDVHDIAVHPSNPDLVFAATGGGLYRSDDGGASWLLLYECYCRALWLDPEDPDHIIFGPAEQVGAGGRIEASRDGGETWNLASGALDVPWRQTMPERIVQIDDELFSVLDDGRVLIASLSKLDWQFVLEGVNDVNAVTAMHR